MDLTHLAWAAAAVALCALTHRLRGGGYFRMPVKGTYVLWPLVGLAAWLAGEAPAACAVWAAGYLAWTLPGWMAEITGAEGAAVPAGQVVGSGGDVRLVTLASFGHPVLAVYLRAAVYLLPLAAALGVYALGFGRGPLYGEAGLALVVVGFWPAYRFGYLVRPADQSSVAEPIVGALWGLAVVFAALAGLR